MRLIRRFQKFFAGLGNSKTLVLLLLAGLASIFLLLVVYFNQYGNWLEQGAVRSLQTALEQTGHNLNNQIKNIELISDNIANNNELIKRLKDKPEDAVYANQLDEMHYMETAMLTMMKSNNAYRIRLFVSDKKIYSKEQISFFELEQAKEYPWYEEVTAARGRPVWQMNYPVDYLDSGRQQVTSCVRILKDYDELSKDVAILAIDIDTSVLREAVNAIAGEETYIIGAKGQIAVHQDPEQEGGTDRGDYSEAVVRRGGQILLNTKIDTAGWRLVTRIDKNHIMAGGGILSDSVTITILILAIILLVMILGFAKFINNVVRRIDLMTSAVEPYGGREPGESSPLYSKIDSVILRSRNLMKDMYEAKAKEREAELKALQAQINTHFLYNTLDAINWMIMNGARDGASHMIGELARYFRLSLNNGRDVVCMSDEIELAQVYIGIQRVRFNNNFSVDFEIDEECRAFLIPKLTLQPVIENALIHGLQKCSPERLQGKKPRMDVAVTKDGDRILLSVTDNGTGMSQEKIDEILSGTGSTGSYGLYNVGERLRLFSGEDCTDCGIEIFSETGAFTTVVMTVKTVSPAERAQQTLE